jgi:tetratricopeptide (TPR) repeat protein
MFKKAVLWMLTLSLAAAAQSQKPAAEAPRPERAPASQEAPGFIAPSDLNVRIEPDARTFVVMAAVNMAGFDYEPGGQPLSPARAELRRDLAKLSPQLKEKLSAYYKAHRRPGVDEALDAARYAALSLLMTAPPAFSIYQATDDVRRKEQTLPADLEPLVDFVPLVREFYLTSGVRELVAKYTGVGQAYAAAYRRPVGELIYKTVDYFHTRPETIINMRPLVVAPDEQGSKSKAGKQSVITRTRTRQVFVIPDPLSAADTSVVRDDLLNQKDDLLARRVGDDYVIIVGPSRTPSVDAIRQGLIRFLIDPLIERHLRAALEYKDPIVKLAASVPTASKQFGSSVYLVLRESLAEAAEARLRRIHAAEGGPAYAEDDATYDLAQAYLRGAVLAFHFYEALTGFEQVGIDIKDFFDQMVATTKFEREAARPKEFEPVVARVTAARKAAPAKPASAAPSLGENITGAVAEKIVLSDDYIRQRKFAEARTVLEEILALQPGNARALYGMAQVVSQTPSKAELDPQADENDKIQAQYERLEQAIKLYRKAIENASAETDRWLMQWSHVLIGRILDFQDFRADAVAEYEKAIALGQVANGAYREALEGKQRPYGQKQQ